ncbi:hypothetical protein K438DRAFT_1866462 [Mycena galopus ATCC 62051]|nr:hypothetical protein K438DRAFT_1866462 [Mycena galopus ATCC 62051]
MSFTGRPRAVRPTVNHLNFCFNSSSHLCNCATSSLCLNKRLIVPNSCCARKHESIFCRVTVH